MQSRKPKEPAVLADGVITALVVPPSRPERVAVHVDGRRAFDLAAELADRAGLRTGKDLTADEQRTLVEQDAPYRARERALRLLALRDRSRGEIELRLRRAGFEAAVAADTVEWLRGLGYLDDQRFAAAFAGEKQRAGWGPRRIRAELAAKRVERSVADEVLHALEPPDADADRGEAAVEQLVRRRFAGQFASDPEAAARRLAGFLARRGYEWEMIARITRSLKEEAGSEGLARDPSEP